MVLWSDAVEINFSPGVFLEYEITKLKEKVDFDHAHAFFPIVAGATIYHYSIIAANGEGLIIQEGRVQPMHACTHVFD